MIPATAIAVVVFTLLIVPGITFELLRQTRRPAFDQTALEEAARILLGSIALGSVGAAVLAATSVVWTDLVIDVSVFARQGLSWYWRQHPGLVISTIALHVIVATTLGALVHRSLNHPSGNGYATWVGKRAAIFLRHEPGQQIEHFRLWRTLFRDWQPKGASTQVTLLKKDGTLITGIVAGYDTSGGSQERDIALTHPIQVLRLGDTLPRELGSEWRYMIVPSSEITEVFLTWPPWKPLG